VGEGAANAIIAERANGPYQSIWDFAERVDQSASNKRVLEALVKCGALPGSRMGMLQVLEQAVGWGQKQQAGPARWPRVDLRPRSCRGREAKHHPPVPTEEFEKTDC